MTKIRYLTDAEVAARAAETNPAEPHTTTLPANELAAPGYGAPQRDAINSLVDGIVSGICQDINAVRALLDEVEQQVLEGAASAKHQLSGQVQICVNVKDEITHMKRVVADIQERGKAVA